MGRLVVCLVVFLVHQSHADNRVDVCNFVTSQATGGLGLKFYTSAELQKIVLCCEPQIYKTPYNNTAIAEAVKTCVLNNSGNKAVQALALYSNSNNCLNPESLDDVVTKLTPPTQQLTEELQTKLKSTLADCKKTNTQEAAAKQETCLQKVYGVVKNQVTLVYVDNVCTQIVNQEVNKQEWGCALKICPSVLDVSRYSCSKIVKN